MAILLVGAGISFFAPQYVAIALICLPIGFVGSNIGSAYMRRFVRKPRPDEERRNLKGLDDRFEFYAWHLPVANVLLGPSASRSSCATDGVVNATDGKWKQPFSMGRVFTVFAREGLGNPTREAADEASRLQSWIQQNLPEITGRLKPVVVFTSPKVQPTLNNPGVTAVALGQLRALVRKSTTSKDKLPDATRKRFSRLFTEAVTGSAPRKANAAESTPAECRTAQCDTPPVCLPPQNPSPRSFILTNR
ncbi:MAG: hypothetical protein HZY76_10735 [Anaerolineae bacterium]|nr:MAG: hypothetical protein HZY76_10735 [Anaerolineae bacterium]